ncbi:MAG: hypothetical protein IT266_10290 [Saprospiraceae bacterium]|nr:hypothetical protein [Saprospiraceae bacterium]
MNRFSDFPDGSRVWIYAADQEVPGHLEAAVREQLKDFLSQWHSHQMPLRATGDLLYRYFVIIVVDETSNAVGGCSLDDSYRFLRTLSQFAGVDFLSRQYAYFLNDQSRVEQTSLESLRTQFLKGELAEDAQVFDTLVNTLGNLKREWIKPLSASWLWRYAST